MKRNEKIFVLALVVPLLLYTIPYAYAVQISSSYMVESTKPVDPGTSGFAAAQCNSGDYVTGGGYEIGPGLVVVFSEAFSQSGSIGPNPHTWAVDVSNPTSATHSVTAQAVCQTPITLAGVTVPEFGSLYIAIALGAVIYFVLARQKYAGKRTAQATTRA